VRNAIDLRESRFNQEVGSVLQSISDRHEKYLAYEDFRSHEAGGYLFRKMDSLKRLNKFEGEDRFNSVVIKDTVVTEDNGRYTVRIVQRNSIDTASGILSTTSSKVYSKKFDRIDYQEWDNYKIKIDDPEAFNDSLQNSYGVFPLSSNEFFHKSKLINDIVNELLEKKLSKDLEERVDLAFLDSVINEELTSAGIRTPFGLLHEYLCLHYSILILLFPTQKSLKHFPPIFPIAHSLVLSFQQMKICYPHLPACLGLPMLHMPMI